MQEKGIHDACLVRTENTVTQDKYSASINKPRDAEQLPSWQNFQSHLTAVKRFS